MRWLIGLALLWAQSVSFDPLVPELPPHELIELQGHFSLKGISWVKYWDSVGDFRRWAERIPWEEGQEWYPTQWVSLSDPLYVQGRAIQYLRLARWQLHRSGQRLRLRTEKVSYELHLQPVSPKRQIQPRFANQSVLASGRWYKVLTNEMGIYHITAQTLRALGIDLSSVDPRHLRLYGQRGGPLPQENSIPPPDDLVEIPLYFPGESDGRWDPSDAAYFWAESPHAWYPLSDSPTRPYFHLRNPYTSECAYFLTFDLGPGQRIQTAPLPPGTAVLRSQVMTFFFHERDSINLVKSGRVWLGENLNTAYPSVGITLPLPAADSVRLRVQVANASFSPGQFNVRWAGAPLGTISVPAIPGPADNRQAQWGELSSLLLSTPEYPNLTISYLGAGQGYIDFIEAVAWHPFRYRGGQQVFYLPAGNTWQVNGIGAPPPFLWDVTDGVAPRSIPLQSTTGGYSFLIAGDTIRRICAFQLEAVLDVRPVGSVPNQNLHSLRGIRFVVATTPAQAALAQRFCDLHPEAGPCAVVTTEALYNEFSGGRPDICALRNFLRMLYARAATPEERPAYLLIVGAASYNFKDKSPTLFPTYQSRESFYPPSTYGSDDFFGFLDEEEGFWGEGALASWYDPRDRILQTHGLDLAITRIPTYSLSDLEAYLAKLTDYLQNPSTRGEWFQKILFFSDYKDGGEHTRQAEQIARQLARDLPYLDQVKLYIDRYPAQPRAAGLVFPEAQSALMAQLGSGAFIAHYVGHGNEYTLQGFEFFPLTAVRQLQNTHRYLFFVTATCEWGKWDEPLIRSGGIEALFLPMRGAIGLLTSTRKVFSTLNFALTLNFYAELSQRFRERYSLRLGDLMQGTKNRSWSGGLNINTRSFSFLGDPLLPLAMPEYEVIFTKIGTKAPDTLQPDTLRPLRLITIEGEIRNRNGSRMNDFSGEITLRLWDKSVEQRTLISQTPFTTQDILLFSGKASVREGLFSLSFYLPVDLLPAPGRGRLSAWAQSPDGRMAGGMDNRFIVCCPDTIPPILPPPVIRLYINDTNWISGRWTTSNPLLLAYISDSLGINLSSLAIGRELKATLNGRDYFLSEYYRAEPDRPNRGKVEYRFQDLPSGEYHLRLRAYNLAGQEGSAETHFIVAESGKLKIGRLFNFPNPFTTATRFFFEHNQPGQPLEARILIYTLSGRLVQTISAPISSSSSLSQELLWDGLDSFGDRLGRGVYVYRLEVRNLLTGETAHATEKMVLLR